MAGNLFGRMRKAVRLFTGSWSCINMCGLSVLTAESSRLVLRMRGDITVALWIAVTIHRMINLTLLLPCFYLSRRKCHLHLLKMRLDGPSCQFGRDTESEDDTLPRNEAQSSFPQLVMLFPRQGFVVEDYIARPDRP
jgi:hypothetical protein